MGKQITKCSRKSLVLLLCATCLHTSREAETKNHDSQFTTPASFQLSPHLVSKPSSDAYMLDKTPSFLTALWWLGFLSFSCHCGLAAYEVPADERIRRTGTHTVLSVYEFLFAVFSSIWRCVNMFDFATMYSEWMTIRVGVQMTENVGSSWMSSRLSVTQDRCYFPGGEVSLSINVCNKVMRCYMCLLKIYWWREIWKESEVNTLSHFYSSSFLVSQTGLNFHLIIIMKLSELLICTLHSWQFERNHSVPPSKPCTPSDTIHAMIWLQAASLPAIQKSMHFVGSSNHGAVTPKCHIAVPQ